MDKALILTIVLIVSGCCNKTVTPLAESDGISFEEKALELFDIDVVIIPNESGEVAIMYRKPKFSSKNPIPTLNVTLYNKEIEQVIYRTSLLRGHVKWISNEEVHFYSATGQINRDGNTDTGYYYHVYNKQRRK